jgi:hypothetical protein
MPTRIRKINHKLDTMADNAKDGAGKMAGRIIDAANNVAHAATEKARRQTKMAGEELIKAGAKITKMAK